MSITPMFTMVTHCELNMRFQLILTIDLGNTENKWMPGGVRGEVIGYAAQPVLRIR